MTRGWRSGYPTCITKTYQRVILSFHLHFENADVVSWIPERVVCGKHMFQRGINSHLPSLCSPPFSLLSLISHFSGENLSLFLLDFDSFLDVLLGSCLIEVMFYKALKGLTDYGMKKWIPNANYQINSTLEGLVLGGVAGGLSAYVTTLLDVIKTRLQVQGPDLRYIEVQLHMNFSAMPCMYCMNAQSMISYYQVFY
ncbi:uncharacterized protein [Spinacia oleracea]|uniref:Uncharacterized protein n=1 Tax=Spinacia oleracea TaxID=3562 RepID=A0A9R0J659_SPIOL|nr:uncharacterized protein LOC110800413 [Spinacia oleracea]